MSHHHNTGHPPPYGYAPPPPPPGALAYTSTGVTQVYPPPPPPGAYAYTSTGMAQGFPPPPPPPPTQGTYVTNYHIQQPHPTNPMPVEPRIHPPVPEKIDWIPSTPLTASSVQRAFVGGKEGWDGNPLLVIRAHHNGELIPGKFASNHRGAYIPNATKEIQVHNFEVLCAAPHLFRWVPASNGQVPAGAFPAGNTRHGEPLYIGRAKHLLTFSVIPGKVHPSHSCCYVSYGGKEYSHKNYEVLCKVDISWR